MKETPPSSVGFVLTGIALVAAFLPWSAESVLLPVAGELADPIATVVAGLPTPDAGLGLVLSLSAGMGAVGMAFVDGTEGRTSLLSKVSATLIGLFVGLMGLVVGTLVAYVVTLGLGIEDTATQIAVLTVLFGVGLAITATGYLTATGKGIGYLDFEVPSLRDLGVVVLGVIGIFGLLYVTSIIISSLGLPTTDNSITEPAQQGNVGTLLALIPLSWLVIGPSEELLYRNVVQKSLYDSFSDWGAVAIASAIFALAHFPAYYSPNVVATLTTLVIVFFLSTILGATYLLTENVTVSALIHGTFDAVLFAALYVTLSGDVPTAMTTWVPEAMFWLLP